MAMEVKIHKKLGEYELDVLLEIHEEKNRNPRCFRKRKESDSEKHCGN